MPAELTEDAFDVREAKLLARLDRLRGQDSGDDAGRMAPETARRAAANGPPRRPPSGPRSVRNAARKVSARWPRRSTASCTKGVAVDGAVTIGVAGVELILLDLRLLLAAIDTVGPDGPFFSAPVAPDAPPPLPRRERDAAPAARAPLPAARLLTPADTAPRAGACRACPRLPRRRRRPGGQGRRTG